MDGRRILFVTSPGLGHLNPLLPLAGRLRERGHDVRFAVCPELLEHVRADGFEGWAAGVGEQERWGLIAEILGSEFVSPEGQPTEKAAAPLVFATLFGQVGARRMAPDLDRIVATWRPDLFVHDLSEFASAPVAASLGVPHVTHSWGGLLPEPVTSGAAARTAELWVQRGLTPPPDGGLFEHLYLVPFPRSFRAGQAALPATAREVRPQAPPGAGAAPSWLESVSDAVYVTLGTVFNDPRALAGIVEAVSAIGRPVIATTGAGVDLSPFHEVLARGTAAPVHVAQYLAQDLVLPRCSAVVSHAGSGTFLGAARHGLPQVLIPRGADQQFNARAGAEAGVGLALGPAAREGGHVREAVERVLADPAFRRRSREISAEIAAMPTLDELLSEVEALATTARPAASR